MAISATSSLAGDMRGIDTLRASVARDPKAAIKEAARQFEAVFMQELMKSMRQATMSSGLLDNAGTQMGTEMLDMQFSQQMTGLPGGLSELIARQLERQMGTPAANGAAGGATAATGAVPTTPPAPLARTGAADAPAPNSRAAQFVQDHFESARAAEASTGIPAGYMVAQAAHESGWGRREILNADGSASHNLFGIKAGPGWKGKVAEIVTTEYVNGEPRKQVAKFRAYDSYADSFADYARLMRDNPRYAPVLANASTPEGFSEGLQRAGYATDPNYADKLTRVINTTLRLQRAMS